MVHQIERELVASLTGKAKVLSNRLNSGKGYSLRRALQHSKGELIVTLDSDGEHKPKEIPLLLAPLFEGYDIVAGSRSLGMPKTSLPN